MPSQHFARVVGNELHSESRSLFAPSTSQRLQGKDPAFAAYDQFLSTGILQPLSQDEVRYGSILLKKAS
jgi:hypothetical protein